MIEPNGTIEADLQPVIVEYEPPQPQEPDPAARAPVSAEASAAAVERLLRPDIAGVVDNPWGDNGPEPVKALRSRDQATRKQARLSPNFIRTAGILAIKGFSDQEIAEAFGVGLAEVKTWEREYPDFKETLSRCKDIQDELVERSLFNIATGYSFPAVDIKVDKDGIVTRTPYIEHQPPNLGACKEWLHNRRPDRWKPDRADGDMVSGWQGGGQRVQIVLYSPHAQAQAVSIQAAPGPAASGGRPAAEDQGGGDFGGYGSSTHGVCPSVTIEKNDIGGCQKI